MPISRQVIAFALLKQSSEVMRTDLLGGISVLIRPLIADLSGQRFSAELLSTRVAQTYGLSIAPSVFEEFIPRFKDAELVGVRPLSTNADEAYFMEVEERQEYADDEASFQGVLDEFLTFAKNKLANVNIDISNDRLIEGLLSRLTSLDFIAIQAKPQRLDPNGEKGKILGPTAKQEQELEKEIGEDAKIDVLVASYISEVIALDSERLTLLSRVADGALAAELVLDLQAPKQVTDLSSVTVVLDTPLLLSLLDLSSRQNHDYAERFVQSIRRVGAKLAAFRHSIEEAEGVLTAVRNGLIFGNAYGPTAERMGSSTYRAFFETMIGRVASRLTDEHQFEIIHPTANHFYQHFTKEDEDKLTESLHFSLLEKRIARERDAQSVAETVRRRGGARIPLHRIDASKFIFLTSNSSLQKQARQFLIRRNLLEKDEFPPVITDRYFSGLLWLLFGGKSSEGLSTAKLLANCANALRLRQDVVQRTKRFLNTLDPIKARHFEALMTSERAAQYMTEITLGDALLVTQENAEKIFEQVEAIAAEKVAKQKDEEYGKKLAEMQEQLSATDSLLQSAQTELTQARLDRDANIEQVKSMNEGLINLQQSLEIQQKLANEQSKQHKELEDTLKAIQSQHRANELALARTRENQVVIATKRSDQKVMVLRFAGIVGLVFLVAMIGYIDKFYSPTLTSEKQATVNIVVICLQVLTSLVSVGAFVEIFFGSLFRTTRRRTFIGQLTELGWSDEEANSAWANSGPKPPRK